MLFFDNVLSKIIRMLSLNGFTLRERGLETISFQAITVFMVINVRLVYKILNKLALFSIFLFKCNDYFSTILDCLPAFQAINEKKL